MIKGLPEQAYVRSSGAMSEADITIDPGAKALSFDFFFQPVSQFLAAPLGTGWLGCEGAEVDEDDDSFHE